MSDVKLRNIPDDRIRSMTLTGGYIDKDIWSVMASLTTDEYVYKEYTLTTNSDGELSEDYARMDDIFHHERCWLIAATMVYFNIIEAHKIYIDSS